MTDVLAARAARLTASVPPEARPSRRLVVVATLAGVAAPLLVVFLLWAVGLVAWFAADGGSHGTTLSVLRLAGDGWLLAHGAHLELAGPPPSVVTASPLGLTLVCVAVTVRVARWAASLSPGGRCARSGVAALALTGAYAVTGLVVALLSRSELATAGLISTVVGCLLLGGPAGALGLVLGTGNAGHLRDLVPVARRSVLVAALAGAGLMLAAGAALTAGSLAWHGGAAAEVAGGLDLDVAGVVFSLLLAALIAPNAALLGSAYLAGPGFAVGTGTVVSTAQVSVGPLPTVPLLAAIPGDGAQPGWLVGLLAVPPLLGVVAAVWAARVVPTISWRSGALRGLGGGALGGLLLTVAAAWAGGSIGPGRMADIGAPLVDLLLWNVAGLGLGGLVGGLAATWWARRHDVCEAVSAPRTRTERPITLYPHLAARQRPARADERHRSATGHDAARRLRPAAQRDADLTEPVLSATVRRRLAESRQLPGVGAPRASRRGGTGRRARVRGHPGRRPDARPDADLNADLDADARPRRLSAPDERLVPAPRVASLCRCPTPPPHPPAGPPVSSFSSPARARTCRRCSTRRSTLRTACRWSRSARTVTPSRGWSGRSARAWRRSSTASGTFPTAPRGTPRSRRAARRTSRTWWCSPAS